MNVLDVFDPCSNWSGNRNCADVDSSKPTVPTENSLPQRIYASGQFAFAGEKCSSYRNITDTRPVLDIDKLFGTRSERQQAGDR